MKQTVIARPFAGGYKSDAPDYALNPNECAYAQDLIAPLGMARQRWGWEYEATGVAAGQMSGVWRASYAIPNTTSMVASAETGYVYRLVQGGSPTTIWNNNLSAGTQWIPRCVYNGDLILCAQDGFTPLLRYAGSSLSIQTPPWENPTGTSYAMNAKSAVLTGGFGASGIEKSSFFSAKIPGAANPCLSLHVLECTGSGTRDIAVDGIRNASSSASGLSGTGQVRIGPVGFAFPAVSVYSVGTMTACTSGLYSYTFSGPSFPSMNTTLPASDALLVVNPTAGSPHMMVDVSSVSGTTITGGAADKTLANTTYHIQRRLPFKDATVHKNSLWGCGVNEYPNRVYVGAPGWNLGLPPGAVDPFDPVNAHTLTDVSDFQIGTIDVPSPLDGDPVVAVLSTGGPLLVLKGSSVYGIFGTYPSFEQTLIANGAGCVDLRSAISSDGVAYWAGRDGIYSYAGAGQIQNLTGGKIQREWQALMRGYSPGSCVSAGIVSGFLIVSVTELSGLATGGAKIGPDTDNPSERTFIYDMRQQVWTGRMGNFNARGMQTARVANETNALYAVSDDHVGKIIDVTPAVTGTKCTDRDGQKFAAADPIDANSLGPQMNAWSSASLAQSIGIEGESRMLDLAIHTNLYDQSTPTTQLDFWTRHGDGLNESADSETSHQTITADTTDRVDRTKRRVNRTGRIHQVKVQQAITDTTSQKSEIPEIVISFRDNRRMT
jgi:hypothetical protein